MLKGFALLIFSSWDVLVRSMPVSEETENRLLGNPSDSAPESPTTSISLSLSRSAPLWLKYSRFKATRSTAIPLARSFLAWRSKAFCSFFLLLARSRARSSAGGMGSPEQDCGWALWAGRPGPFLVCSFFRHFALRFWNQTWKEKEFCYWRFL